MAISDELRCCACVTSQPISGQLKLASTLIKSFPAISLPRSARDPILVKRMTEAIPGEDVDHSLSISRQLFVSISHLIGSLFCLRHG